jgi:4-hydroxysphinganine ceramide fatty acyl 2-hydroxylase
MGLILPNKDYLRRNDSLFMLCADGSALVGFWIFGLFLWTLVEYGMHRFLFHVDEWLPDNRYFLTIHFTLHGVHHYLPTDRYIPTLLHILMFSLRLVMPPTLFLALAYPWYKLTQLLFPYYIALAIYSGGITGYIIYDLTHYFLHHHRYPPSPSTRG